jgi:hypothetical protein
MNTSSRTMNSRLEEEGFGNTPGGAPPRERVKMKKVTISTRIVVVFVVFVARDVVVGSVDVALAVVRSFVAKEVASWVVDRDWVVEFAKILATDVATEVAEAWVTKAVVEAFEMVEFATILATDVATEVAEVCVTKAVVEAFEMVEFAGVEVVSASVMTQEVAAPLPSTWQTTGWKAAGGQVSCVRDIRYRSHMNVNRLLPTVAAGVVCVMNTLSKPLKKGGATATMLVQ